MQKEAINPYQPSAQGTEKISLTEATPIQEYKPVASIKSDYEQCRNIMKSASKNYSFASLFFPRDKLPHVEALYALMRVGDDRVDVSYHGFRSSLEAIDDWENKYREAFQHGDSPHPVMRAYLNTARTFDIPAGLMNDFFRAMRDDLKITRFPTFGDLLHYMDGSAIPVGRAMVHILGARNNQPVQNLFPGADSLSIAMQLSNFWRDIGQDWEIGRVYIPLEDLDRFEIHESEIAERKITEKFVNLLKFEIERTETYYHKAQPCIKELDSGRWAVMMGFQTYRSILSSIRRNNYDVFHKRAQLGATRRLVLSPSAFLVSRA